MPELAIGFIIGLDLLCASVAMVIASGLEREAEATNFTATR